MYPQRIIARPAVSADQLAAELAAEFEEFADRHRQAVWDEVLTPIREAKGDPNWRPKGMMEGLGYQARVSKVLRQRFVAQLRVK